MLGLTGLQSPQTPGNGSCAAGMGCTESDGEESDEEVPDEESDDEEASESDASMQEESDGAQSLEELSDDDGMMRPSSSASTVHFGQHACCA